MHQVHHPIQGDNAEGDSSPRKEEREVECEEEDGEIENEAYSVACRAVGTTVFEAFRSQGFEV